MKKPFLSAMLAAALAATPAAFAEEELVFAVGANVGSVQGDTAQEFARRVNQKLAGKIKLNFFHSGQLGKDKELMQKIKVGSVHFSMPSSVMANVAPEFGVFDMPFIIRDREHLARAEEKVFWSSIAPKAEAKGYKVLAIWENGVRQITNNTRPINKPADLKGIKLRVPGNKWRAVMFAEWGANPTKMSFGEVFTALETKVIDGQENPLANIDAAKLNEVQTYLSMTHHVYSPSYLVTSVKIWNDLPADVRDALSQTAREMELWARAEGKRKDNSLRDKLAAAGMKVNNADKQAFIDASAPVYAKFAQEVAGGQALIDAVQKL
jgi:tripartite ATP-independent transporter DctP family solute receptor